MGVFPTGAWLLRSLNTTARQLHAAAGNPPAAPRPATCPCPVPCWDCPTKDV